MKMSYLQATVRKRSNLLFKNVWEHWSSSSPKQNTSVLALPCNNTGFQLLSRFITRLFTVLTDNLYIKWEKSLHCF